MWWGIPQFLEHWNGGTNHLSCFSHPDIWSLLVIVLYLTYIGKRQRQCPLHRKRYLDNQSINAYHPTKGAQVRTTISWLNLGQLESKWVDHLSPHACIFHNSPTGLHHQCCSSNAIQVQEKQSMCLPHSLEVSTRITYAGGTTEEDDALLEETLCKTTNDHKSKKWRTMNYWEEKLWY